MCDVDHGSEALAVPHGRAPGAAYFTTRQKNPLKGKQAIIAAGCKLIRVFYTILKHGVDYDPQKLRMDIIRPESAAA